MRGTNKRMDPESNSEWGWSEQQVTSKEREDTMNNNRKRRRLRRLGTTQNLRKEITWLDYNKGAGKKRERTSGLWVTVETCSKATSTFRILPQNVRNEVLVVLKRIFTFRLHVPVVWVPQHGHYLMFGMQIRPSGGDFLEHELAP